MKHSGSAFAVAGDTLNPEVPQTGSSSASWAGFHVAEANGSLASYYQNDPYGNLIASSGVLAAENPWRFSTKYFEPGTGLGYWGYRWYDPGTGRWVGRDPIGENGWMEVHTEFHRAMSGDDEEGNLFLFVENDPNSHVDFLGALGLKTTVVPLDAVPLAVVPAVRPNCECGDFYWQVRFVTKDGKEEKGWVIQKVTLQYIAKTIMTSVAVSTYPQTLTFYEAFEVTKSADPYDSWWHLGPGTCTYGVETVEATAAFFWIGTLPTTFIKDNPQVHPYSDEFATTTPPRLFGLTPRTWISNYIHRKLRKTWMCDATETYRVTAAPQNIP